MSNQKEANFGFQEFVVWFQFIPNKKGSTNSVTEISKTFELSEQIILSLALFLSFSVKLPIDKIPNRHVSIFTPGWEISVRVKNTNLSQLILKEWKKKNHEQYHHTRLKIQRLKYKIKYSKSNWSKSIAMGKLTKLKINHENLKHQVQANGWKAWRKDENVHMEAFWRKRSKNEN
ncbi:unnamed protein product [Malus baccata var. baccata]